MAPAARACCRLLCRPYQCTHAGAAGRLRADGHRVDNIRPGHGRSPRCRHGPPVPHAPDDDHADSMLWLAARPAADCLDGFRPPSLARCRPAPRWFHVARRCWSAIHRPQQVRPQSTRPTPSSARPLQDERTGGRARSQLPPQRVKETAASLPRHPRRPAPAAPGRWRPRRPTSPPARAAENPAFASPASSPSLRLAPHAGAQQGTRGPWPGLLLERRRHQPGRVGERRTRTPVGRPGRAGRAWRPAVRIACGRPPATSPPSWPGLLGFLQATGSVPLTRAGPATSPRAGPAGAGSSREAAVFVAATDVVDLPVATYVLGAAASATTSTAAMAVQTTGHRLLDQGGLPRAGRTA